MSEPCPVPAVAGDGWQKRSYNTPRFNLWQRLVVAGLILVGRRIVYSEWIRLGDYVAYVDDESIEIRSTEDG